MTRRKSRGQKHAAVLVTAFVALALASATVASITSTSGQMTLIAAPPSVVFNTTLESDTTMFAFDEKQCVQLTAPLDVDITEPGLYDQDSEVTRGTIPAGTFVSSHFIHSDRVDETNSPPLFLEGSISTSEDVLGIIALNQALHNSDAVLGAPGTTYPTGTLHRGMDLKPVEIEYVEWQGVSTVTVRSNPREIGDQVRVVTACNVPPNCAAGAASPKILWPPNHKFREVTVGGVTDPNGDPVTVTITGVTQDEPLNGPGDGNTSPDAAPGSAPNKVLLRAERTGKGDGRVYRIAFTAADNQGGACSGVATVGVPHDMGAHSVPIDSGLVVNSFGP